MASFYDYLDNDIILGTVIMTNYGRFYVSKLINMNKEIVFDISNKSELMEDLHDTLSGKMAYIIISAMDEINSYYHARFNGLVEPKLVEDRDRYIIFLVADTYYYIFFKKLGG